MKGIEALDGFFISVEPMYSKGIQEKKNLAYLADTPSVVKRFLKICLHC